MKKNAAFAIAFAAALAVALLTTRAPATEAHYAYDGPPEIVAATFSSAWCSACKVLEPRLAKVAPDFADRPVKFVNLDFTFGQKEDIAEKAASEGLGDIYPSYKGATGFTVLVDRETGDVIDTLTINHSADAMRAAIAQALARAQNS